MMDENLQKRMLLIVVLSFIFFVLYDYFLIPKKNIDTASSSTTEAIQDKNKAPVLETVSNAAPATQLSTDTAPPMAGKADTLVDVTHQNFHLKIDKFGRVSSLVLRNDNYSDIELLSDEFVKPLELRFSDPKTNEEAFKIPYTASKNSIVLDQEDNVVLTQKLSNVTVTKSITLFSNGTYHAKISLSEDTPYFITPGFRPIAAVDPFAFHGVLIKEQDDTLTMYDDEDLSKSESFQNTKITAAVDKYFVTLFYDFTYPLNGVVDKYKEDNPLIFVQGKNGQIFNGYIGAKSNEQISAIDKRLTDVIEYGFITFFAKPIFTTLEYIYKYIGNWGWAIVILTIFIRILLFPLTYKGMVSMNKLKELSPKIKEIQEKYKGNPQRSSAAMMELYKKHGLILWADVCLFCYKSLYSLRYIECC